MYFLPFPINRVLFISLALSVAFSLEFETAFQNKNDTYELINGDLYRVDRASGTNDGLIGIKRTRTSGVGHSIYSETSTTQRQKDVWTIIHNFASYKTNSIFNQEG